MSCLEPLSGAVWRGDLTTVQRLLLRPHVEHLIGKHAAAAQQLQAVDRALASDVQAAAVSADRLHGVAQKIAAM